MYRSYSTISKDKVDRNINLFDLLLLFVFGFSSILFAIMMIGSSSITYKYVFLLPLTSGILYLISFILVKDLKYNLINIIIYSTYFIRNSITPFLLYLSDYPSKITLLNNSLVNKGIVIMIIDSVVVFTYLSTLKNKNNNGELNFKLKRPKVFYSFLITGTLFCLYAYNAIPQIQNGYISLFSGEFSDLSTEIPTSPINLMIYRLFIFIFPIIQLLLPIQIITMIRLRIGEKLISIILSMLLAVTPLLFVGNTSAFSFILVITIFFVIIEVYPKFRNFLFVIVGILSFGGLTYFFWRKIADGSYHNSLSTFASFFQAYFPGIYNISSAFAIPDSLSQPRILMNDYLSMFPFVNTILPNLMVYNNSTYSFLTTINYEGQILSNISLSYLHLNIFAPFINILIIKLANRFYMSSRGNVHKFSAFTLAAIYFSITLTMYNFSILGATFFKNLFILLIFVRYISYKDS